MSFLTWRCDFPQKLQRSCSLPSLARAIPVSYYPEFRKTARAAVLSDSLDTHCVAVRDHRIDQPVSLRFLRTEEEIPLHVARNLVLALFVVQLVALLHVLFVSAHLAC